MDTNNYREEKKVQPKGKDYPYVHCFSVSGYKEIILLNTQTLKCRAVTVVPTLTQLFSTSIMVKNSVYVVGGCLPDSSRVYEVQILESSGTSCPIEKAQLCAARGCAGLTRYGDRYIYALGGNRNTRYVKMCERFDTERNVWSKIPSLNKAKSSISGCEMNAYLEVRLCYWTARREQRFCRKDICNR